MSFALLLNEKAKLNPSKTFLLGDRSLTYSQVIEEVSHIASNFSPGETVVHIMYNSTSSIIAYLSAFWAGAKVVALDPLTSAEDLKFILDDSDPSVIITDEEIYSREKNVLKEYKKVLTSLPKGERIREPYEYKDDEAGLIYYYAGIAGKTMQVLHSPRRVVKNIEAIHKTLHLSEIRSILTVPLAHVLGNNVLGTTIYAGGALYVMRKFNVKELIDVINTYNINYLSTVPMVYDSLLAENASLSSLELCVSSAAPLSPTTLRMFKEKFNKDILQAYGLTECLAVSYQPKEYAGILTIGKPLLGAEVKIVKEDGKEARVGEVGELYVRAPWVMLGYKDESETRKVFEGEWLKTGDLVSMDEKGLLYFKGVKKRMLKYKGYPIFPRDLEDILRTHPLVKGVKVVGEDEGVLGQKPVAYVIVKEKKAGLEEELLNYVNSKVAFYKKLKKVIIVDKLP